nr:hypothetical protein [Klebsiella pneumoniae]
MCIRDSWGVVDYLRQPKAGYYALQRAYQPILPSIEPVTPAGGHRLDGRQDRLIGALQLSLINIGRCRRRLRCRFRLRRGR